MGILVRLIGSSVGLAAESISSHKHKSGSRSPQPELSPQPSASSSREVGQTGSIEKNEKPLFSENDNQEDHEEPPPAYENVVEVSEDHADELIANGQAVPLDEKHIADRGAALDEDESDTDSAGDEAHWALDEAAEEVASLDAEDPKLKYGMMAQPTIESFASLVMAKVPPLTHPVIPLRCPVIIPQRRPGARGRGFIHAYAPDLADSGITQEAFLSFIQTFHQATQASPLLNVVFLSAGVAGLVPEPITQITSTVLQFAVGAAIYMQTTQRTHTFLDEMNNRLFKPRGLYAIVMKYIPNGTRPIYVQHADLNTVISNEDAPHKSYQNFRAVNAGRSYGAVEMPDSAPLIFPALDEVAETQDPAKANKMKDKMAFVADYYDRRGRASYLQKSPDQHLDMPKPDFAARVSDPNHPAFRGGLLTLISGGKIPPKAERRMKKREEMLQAGFTPSRKMERKAYKYVRKQKKKQMKVNVLYLMIVNMPTEQELEAAKTHVQQQDARMG